MSACKYLVLILSLLFIHTKCENKADILKRIEAINNRSRHLYGDSKWKFELNQIDYEDGLVYPRTNKHKLSQLATEWRAYYSCTARSLNSLTSSLQLPSTIVAVYEETVATLTCAICVAPSEAGLVTWMYAQSPKNLTFTERELKDRMVEEDETLIIYNVVSEDAGVYQCRLGDSTGGLVLLEVVDQQDYIAVKPKSSQGPYPSSRQRLNNGLIVFSSWYAWSECSVCGKVGRQHRHGMCYVKLDSKSIRNANKPVAIQNDDVLFVLDDNIFQLLQAFPKGIPCRSQYLPKKIREITAVQQRKNEIMMRMCKVPCKDQIFELRSPSGTLLDHANNTAGIYSLLQVVPKQRPLTGRNTIFADVGQPIAIKCPGTTLRDVPITWRVGTKLVIPRHVHAASGGRVYLNSRDHLVITAVLYRDANLYSCWQHDGLAGTVKLIVWAGGHAYCNHHVVLGILVTLAAILLSFLLRRLTNVQRHNRYYINK